MSAIAEPTMAKRNDTVAKIDAEVIRIAKIVAAYRSTSVAEYLSAILAPIVERDLLEEQAKSTKGTREPKPPRR